jgi:Xaa-Pro aminopeptidase
MVMSPEEAEAARARHARVLAAMGRHGVGALLLATPHLGVFAAGARRVRVAGSGGTVPWVAIVAGTPAPTVFTPDPDGAPGWMPREAVEPLRWDRTAQLTRLAELVRPSRGAVACDVFSPALRELAESLGRPLVDAAPLLAEATAPRTRVEVALISEALGAARSGLRAAMADIGPETTPAALAARFAASMSVSRSGFPLSEGLAWRVSTQLERLSPASRCGAGDRVALELGLYVAGHAGIVGDTIACGGGALTAVRRRWSEALSAVAGRCRAGATTADVRAAARAAGAGQERLLAHGLGVGIEPPYVDLDADDEAPLRAGTVLVLAPVFEAFRATRALVVTDGAARWIEAAP